MRGPLPSGKPSALRPFDTVRAPQAQDGGARVKFLDSRLRGNDRRGRVLANPADAS